MGYKDLDKKQTVAGLISGHSLALQFNPERNIVIEKNGKSIWNWLKLQLSKRLD